MSYSETYFNTFDNLDPILDREHFKHGIMARLLREGYVEDDPSAVLALLVFALAEVAIAGINAQPLGESETYPSRFQSGTAEQPPGLALFNEARRRLAFIRTDGSLEHVQILLLQATYYEASARHLDYWSSATAASMACQLVIRSSNVDWTSAYGDSVSRAFWSCLIKEDLFRLDLDLPRTGIADLHERVPCPHFRSAEMGKDSNPRNSHHSFDGKQKKHHASFLALIELKSLISSIGTVFEEGKHVTRSTRRSDCRAVPTSSHSLCSTRRSTYPQRMPNTVSGGGTRDTKPTRSMARSATFIPPMEGQ